MADFLLEDRKLSLDEGIYDDNPDDTGGETVLGVARNKIPEWKGFPLVDRIKVRLGLAGAPVREKGAVLRLSAAIVASPEILAAASELRREKFWDSWGLSSCPSQAVAGELYNGMFNVGKSRERLIAARALNALNREQDDWADLPLGQAARFPDGMNLQTYMALPPWVRMPIMMVYPPAFSWGSEERKALEACLAKGREESLFKALSGIREEWYVTWIERNPRRERQAGVLSRPYSRS